jgi:DNA-directed RNA polymerase subunit K/omega
VVRRPTDIGAFHFAVVAALRAAQLTRGCLPRVDGLHKVAVTAQMEVSGRFVESVDMPDAALFRSGEL